MRRSLTRLVYCRHFLFAYYSFRLRSGVAVFISSREAAATPTPVFMRFQMSRTRDSDDDFDAAFNTDTAAFYATRRHH